MRAAEVDVADGPVAVPVGADDDELPGGGPAAFAADLDAAVKEAKAWLEAKYDSGWESFFDKTQ